MKHDGPSLGFDADPATKSPPLGSVLRDKSSHQNENKQRGELHT